MKIENPFFSKPSDHKPLTFDIFSVSRTPTHPDFSCDAFAQKTGKLSWMLKSVGHKTRHYGNEMSDVVCDEHITVTSKEQLLEAYPDHVESKGHVDFLSNENRDAVRHLDEMYTLNTAYEVRKRCEPGDNFCYVVPTLQHELANKLMDLPVNHVETGVGYMGSYLPYRVFESPGIQAWHYGYWVSNFDRYNKLSEEEKKSYRFSANTHQPTYDPPKLDCVIPNSFYVSDFDFRIKKDNYLLYLGRIIPMKGIVKAVKIAKKLGLKLVVAGPGDFEKELKMKVPKHVEIVGPVGPEKRRGLLSNAMALLCITDYWEPFGGVHIEAMLSGTPPIASDNGGFVHTIRSGWNGYRLNMNQIEQGVWACKNLDKIDPYVLRDFGLRFSNEQIALRYYEYFDSLTKLIQHNGDMLEIENPNRDNLDWLDYDRKIEWPDGWMVPVDDRKGEKDA